MYKFKREGKYLVLKVEDIEAFLSIIQKTELQRICSTIDLMRRSMGKKFNSYVVVNEDEPYAEQVWKLIQEEEERKNDSSKKG